MTRPTIATFKQLVLLVEKAHNAADRIYRAIVPAHLGAKALKPILFPYENVGTTAHVDFFNAEGSYGTLALCAGEEISHLITN